MATDAAGNQKVDFVWGNMPMQPDTARGAAVLTVGLGNHDIAKNAWNGFPDYLPVAPYLDSIINVAVPVITGLLEAAATTALTNAGLVKGTVTVWNTAQGATAGNTGKIAAVAVTEGSMVNVGSTINVTRYTFP
jgi:multidrug efflux pump subunit AcrA (membrane-fusion protein)